jgi:Xaa-Pro aminopeptidase
MNNKLQEIRTLLAKHKIDAYLVPMKDAFGSEYLAPQFRRIEYLTWFTGSNAFVVITKNKAGFFTDGRYTTQSKIEVNSKDFSLHDLSEFNETDFLNKNLKSGKIGFDPEIFSIGAIQRYKEKLGKSFKLEPINENLIDKIWNKKPVVKKSTGFIFSKKFSGKDFKEKLTEIFKNIKDEYIFLTNAESICWALNIRGDDLANTPVVLAYALISRKMKIEIFVYNAKFKDKLPKEINVKNFSQVETSIKKLKGKKLLIDKNNTPYKIYDLLERSGAILNQSEDPVVIRRAVKNTTEVEAIRFAHEKDGAALVKFFCYLDQQLKQKKNIDELKVAEKLIELRSKNKNFFSTSFDTIAGFNSNGAIIHYRASEKTNKQIKGDGILLVDSGAQYLEGTTDVTRTIAIGKPTSEQKRNFTLVLKGHIGIAKQKILKGTSGAQIDILARQHLWNNFLDYKHGTGHGVGHFLNVHEGPHGISKYNNTPLQSGMIISNEPGYYEVNNYGIRIEALVLVKDSKNKNFLEFETLTQCFIDRNLIDDRILTGDEKKWLNDYHAEVFERLKKHLNKTELKFLKDKTRKI